MQGHVVRVVLTAAAAVCATCYPTGAEAAVTVAQSRESALRSPGHVVDSHQGDVA